MWNVGDERSRGLVQYWRVLALECPVQSPRNLEYTLCIPTRTATVMLMATPTARVYFTFFPVSPTGTTSTID
jgi:hypothetical protein